MQNFSTIYLKLSQENMGCEYFYSNAYYPITSNIFKTLLYFCGEILLTVIMIQLCLHRWLDCMYVTHEPRWTQVFVKKTTLINKFYLSSDRFRHERGGLEHSKMEGQTLMKSQFWNFPTG